MGSLIFRKFKQTKGNRENKGREIRRRKREEFTKKGLGLCGKTGRVIAVPLAVFIVDSALNSSEAKAQPPEKPQITEHTRDLCALTSDCTEFPIEPVKKIKLPLYTGYSVFANEGGSSFSADLSWEDYVSAGLGVMWFNPSEPHPFLNVLGTPHFNLWKDYLRMGYIGNVAVSYPGINSTLYTSHGMDISFQYPFHEKFKMGVGTLIQAGFSFPTYDDIYAKWAVGLKINFLKNFEVYSMVLMNFAASKTPKTQWALDYAPRFQGVEVGFSWAYLPTFTASLFANFDVIQPYAGGSITRQIVSIGGWNIYVFGSAGLSSWNSDFFETLNFFIFAGVQIDVDDSHNLATLLSGTNHKFQYENMNLGNTPEFSLKSVSLDAGEVEDARDSLLSSSSFEELLEKYKGKSADEVLLAANYFGKVLGEVGYNYGALEKMEGLELFDPVVEEMVNEDYSDLFEFVKNAVDFYETNGGWSGMPDEIKKGISICGGIHEFLAEFLRQNGLNAYAISVNTANTAHVVTLVFHEGKASIVDYGKRYTAESGSLDEVLRIYMKTKGVPIFNSQVFTKGGVYLGTYTTPEGRVLHKTFGVDVEENMKSIVLKFWK
ncbi:hypothetical protein JXB01_01530 [Candidatus Micrarchaeota archaeon]|nr:hypothetical protein [Candidatus Micrarchaeota archaeon]